jgi:hypothetical protein
MISSSGAESNMQESINDKNSVTNEPASPRVPSDEIQKELPVLKKLVEKSHMYFKDNYRMFNEFRRFVFETSITETERNINDTLGMPNLEFNVVPAYLSRLCGEFSKQEPGIEVSKDEGAQVSTQTMQVVEGHFRHILDDAAKTNVQYHTYRDSISGGFANLKVVTERAHARSNRQVIKMRKARFPTLTGFDPMAEQPHKGDGNYSFECFPKSKEDFKEEFSHINIDEIKFYSQSSLEGFSWAFNNSTDDIILLCKMFKKKKKKTKMMELVDGQVLTEKEYKEFVKKFQSSNITAQLPAIVGNTWYANITTICRYIFIETFILEYTETDFNELPDVFVDGDSVDLYDNQKGMCKQLTRPYAINAKGAQQLKNLGGQALAAYLERLNTAKFIIKKEAIPQERSYLNSLTDLQQANTIVVNAFKDNNPDHAIPDPIREIQPTSAPPEIMGAITIADQIIQNVLGSYDAALGINDNQLSGVAIVEAATQSQAAAMPFVVNYLAALNQVAVIIVDLIPKYYKTPTTIPVIDREGKKSYVRINDKEDPNSVDMNYDSNALHVKVTAGVNFAIQKSKALNQLIQLCKAIPGFAQFIERKGLKLVIDNLEIRGADVLKDLAEEYQQEMQQAGQEQKQMQAEMMANDPKAMGAKNKAMEVQASATIKVEDMQLKREKMEIERDIAMQKLQFEKEEMEIKREIAQADKEASLARAHAEEVRANADMIMARKEMEHKQAKESLEHIHKVNESKLDREERQNEREKISSNEER